MAIIITLCTLLLLSYIFDLSSSFTRIPSVILLLLLGWAVKQLTVFFGIPFPSLSGLLPVLGTIGLILIVLEGSLELELNRSKSGVIIKATFISIIPMLILAFLIAAGFHFLASIPFKTALVNAIPFCVISSSIAIPSAQLLHARDREFIIYESSLSDIFGVLFFNFMALNEHIDLRSFGIFSLQVSLITVISFLSVAGLSFLLSRIKHHISYTPIILLIMLIFSISKVYHLPGLIFILVFGLFLGNLNEIKRFEWIRHLRPEKLDKEVIKFKGITSEATFLIRSLFFLLFGFLMDAGEILNLETLPWAVGIVGAIMLTRWITLKAFGLSSSRTILFLAPRGLITILLFLSILPADSIPLVNNSLMIQTIILSVLTMMFGSISGNKEEMAPKPNPEKHTLV